VLTADLGPGVGPAEALEAVEALRRRSLVERREPGASFTSPPVVLEYVTQQLVERGADEIERGELTLLASQPLVKARAKDYVRRTQERLIAAPLLERVAGRTDGPEATAQRHCRCSPGLREVRRDGGDPFVPSLLAPPEPGRHASRLARGRPGWRLPKGGARGGSCPGDPAPDHRPPDTESPSVPTP
jgi:hypothetical protein